MLDTGFSVCPGCETVGHCARSNKCVGTVPLGKTYPAVSMAGGPVPPTGWVCPSCGTANSPAQAVCARCSPEVNRG